jgi:hypothetical protein
MISAQGNTFLDIGQPKNIRTFKVNIMLIASILPGILMLFVYL